MRKTRWWHPTLLELKCEACRKIKPCLEYQGKGTAKCGYNRLCEECYGQKVKHVYKAIVKKGSILIPTFVFLLGLIVGVFISLGVYTELPKKMTYVRTVSEQEKQVLTDWAVSKSKNTSEQIIRQIVNAACESEFPALVMAIIGAETLPKFDPGSVSNKNCWGPMQVNPKVWVETLIKEEIIKTNKDLFDPTLGVRAGIYVFCKYLEKDKGNLRKATRRYVGGIHNKKEAEKYFNLIQLYLGEIYLAMYEKQKEIRKEKDNNKKEEENN